MIIIIINNYSYYMTYPYIYIYDVWYIVFPPPSIDISFNHKIPLRTVTRTHARAAWVNGSPDMDPSKLT